MVNIFAPKAGRFGVMPVVVTSGELQIGTLAAGTLTFSIGAYPKRAMVSKVAVSAQVYPTADANTVKLVKYDASANAAVDLTTATSVNALTAREGIELSPISTLTAAQRTLDAGDTLELVLVTTGAVTVQDVGIVANVELLVLE